MKLVCPPEDWKNCREIDEAHRSLFYWAAQQLGLTYRYDPTGEGKVYLGLPKVKAAAEPAPAAGGKNSDNILRFTMRLPKTAEATIIDGVIVLNGQMYKACSGNVGSQVYGTYWITGRSPIPPGKDYKIDLQWHYSDLAGIAGRYYHILPDPIDRGDGSGLRRTEIGLHQDNGAPGTSGCIGVVNNDWSRLCTALDELAKFNRYLRLEVEYICRA